MCFEKVDGHFHYGVLIDFRYQMLTRFYLVFHVSRQFLNPEHSFLMFYFIKISVCSSDIVKDEIVYNMSETDVRSFYRISFRYNFDIE